jgi:predicted GNAT superfamily acetyltransferase
MQSVVIRDAVPGDFDTICSLNLAEVQHTSPMDRERLLALDELSCFHKVACADSYVAAFLLAMSNEAAYENSNFEWFARRYRHFMYIDRIVVSPDFRGLRLGSLLYEELFRSALHSGIPLVTCEYNIVPPNEPSRILHEKFGFKEQGTQWVASGTKKVSLQAAETGQEISC